jgi:hypothetical protein
MQQQKSTKRIYKDGFNDMVEFHDQVRKIPMTFEKSRIINNVD